MKLSSGKILTFTSERNGSQTINEVLTEQEYTEYCELMQAEADANPGHRFVVGYSVQKGQVTR